MEEMIALLIILAPFALVYAIVRIIELVCSVYLNIHEAKEQAIKNIYVNAVIQCLPVRIADSTNTKLNLSTAEEKEIMQILFEDAIREKRLFTEIEIQMIKEIILNSPSARVKKNALESLNKYLEKINQNAEFNIFDIRIAHMMIEFDLNTRLKSEQHDDYDKYYIYYYDIV